MEDFRTSNAGDIDRHSATHSFEQRTRPLFLAFLLYLITLWFVRPLAVSQSGITMGLFALSAMIVIAPFCVTRPLFDLRHNSRSSTSVLCISIFLLLIWSFMSTLYAENPLRSGRTIFTYVQGITIYICLIMTASRRRLYFIVGTLVAFASIMSLLSLGSYFIDSIREILFVGRDRSQAFFRHPNQFAIALSCIAPAALMCALTSKRYRIPYAIAFGLIIFGLVAAGSKANLIISYITSLIAFFSHSLMKKSTSRKAIALLSNILAMTLVTFIGIWLLSAFNPRALTILSRFILDGGEVATVISRQIIWSVSIEQFLEDPIFGVGAGQLVTGLPPSMGMPTHSHNVIVDHLRMLGVVGGIGIGLVILTSSMLLLGTLRRALSSRISQVCDRGIAIGLALGGLAYIAGNMLSDSFGPSTSPFFWIVLSLAVLTRSLLPTKRARIT